MRDQHAINVARAVHSGLRNCQTNRRDILSRQTMPRGAWRKEGLNL
jgi:hypothetical protein